MEFLIEQKEKSQKAHSTLLTNDPKVLSILSNDLTLKILKELGKQPCCTMDIARNLKQHEQKIYYHIRKLAELGLIKLDKIEQRVGGTAKIYSPISSTISFKLFDQKPIRDIKTRAREIDFLKPFIENGKLNSIMVIGSPDPHGTYKAPASDGYCAIDLGIFFGQYIGSSKLPYYKLDTQVRTNDLKNNIILIGGPKTNIISYRINKKLPIYFDYSKERLDWEIVSSLSKSVYSDERIGIVEKIKSPFSEDKEILFFAGKGFRGSLAAVIAFIKYPEKIMDGNSNNKEIIAKVVKGIDIDSDGIIDDVEFLE